jgi:hypothetical protein
MPWRERFVRARRTGHFTDGDFAAALEGGWLSPGLPRATAYAFLRGVAQNDVDRARTL